MPPPDQGRGRLFPRKRRFSEGQASGCAATKAGTHAPCGFPRLAAAGEALSCCAATKRPGTRTRYASQSSVTQECKDMGSSPCPAWVSSGGDRRATGRLTLEPAGLPARAPRPEARWTCTTRFVTSWQVTDSGLPPFLIHRLRPFFRSSSPINLDPTSFKWPLSR